MLECWLSATQPPLNVTFPAKVSYSGYFYLLLFSFETCSYIILSVAGPILGFHLLVQYVLALLVISSEDSLGPQLVSGLYNYFLPWADSTLQVTDTPQLKSLSLSTHESPASKQPDGSMLIRRFLSLTLRVQEGSFITIVPSWLICTNVLTTTVLSLQKSLKLDKPLLSLPHPSCFTEPFRPTYSCRNKLREQNYFEHSLCKTN